jgi:hypothetical protein
MPRFVVNVPEDQPAEVGGLKIKAALLRGRGRRLRVVIDIPPGWRADGEPIVAMESSLNDHRGCTAPNKSG